MRREREAARDRELQWERTERERLAADPAWRDPMFMSTRDLAALARQYDTQDDTAERVARQRTSPKVKPKPKPKAQLQLQLQRYAPAGCDDASAECGVCLAPFVAGELLGLPCDQPRHRFHASCIRAWLAMQPTCPVCRFDRRLAPAGGDARLLPSRAPADIDTAVSSPQPLRRGWLSRLRAVLLPRHAPASRARSPRAAHTQTLPLGSGGLAG